MDVLEILGKGKSYDGKYEKSMKPTHLMYLANLSWNPLREILDRLENRNLVDRVEHPTRTTYRITAKGRGILGYWMMVKDSTGEVLRFEDLRNL